MKNSLNLKNNFEKPLLFIKIIARKVFSVCSINNSKFSGISSTCRVYWRSKKHQTIFTKFLNSALTLKNWLPPFQNLEIVKNVNF